MLDKVEGLLRIKYVLNERKTPFTHLTEVKHVLDECFHQVQLARDNMSIFASLIQVILAEKFTALKND